MIVGRIFGCLVVAFLFGAIPAFSQVPAKCELRMENAPVFRGLRLGMDESRAATAIGTDFMLENSPYPRFSSAYASMLNTANPLNVRNPMFNDVLWVRLESIDRRVTRIMINYKPEWNSLKEFADHFIPQIPLPTDAWTFVDDNRAVANTCSGFDILLDLNGRHGRVTLTDTVSVERRLAQIEAEKEAGRRALKP